MTNDNAKETFYIEAVLNLLRAEDSQQAISLLENLIRKSPETSSFHVLLGAAFSQQGDSNLAESSYRRALEIDPNDPKVQKALGLLLMSLKRYSEALPFLQQLFEKNELEQTAVPALSWALEKTPGHEGEGLKILEETYQKSENPIIGLKLGKQYYFLNKLDEAIRVLNTLPKDKDVGNLYLAKAYLARYKFNESIAAINEYLEENPDNILAKVELARAFAGLSEQNQKDGNPEKALELIEKAILNYPSSETYIEKTKLLLEQEKYTESLDTVKIGLELATKENNQISEINKSILYLLRELIYIEQGKENILVNELLEDIKKQPTNIILIDQATKYLIKFNRMQEALDIVERSLPEDRSPETNACYYYLLHYYGKVEEAKNIINNIGDLQEDFIEEIADIGTRGYLRGQIVAAISSFEQLQTIEQNDKRLNTNLAYFLIGESKFSEAEILLRRVLSANNSNLYEAIALCDLAYLYCIQNKYPEALEVLGNPLSIENREIEATLHIPFFVFGEMKPDFAPFPGRSIKIGSAISACRASASMAAGNFDVAEFSIEALNDGNYPFISNLLIGNLELAKNEHEKAKEYWEKAYQSASNDEDKGFVNNILEKLS